MCLKSVGAAFLAAFLWALVGVILMQAFRQDPSLSPLVATLVRILVNLVMVIFIHQFVRGRSGLPWGSGQRMLWVWGGLGALTICTYFGAVQRVGASEANLFQGAQVLLVSALGPSFTGERFSKVSIGASLLGLLGYFLFFRAGSSDLSGKSIALFSGISAGLAYLVLSRERQKHSLETVGFYWSVCSLFVIGIASLFAEVDFRWNRYSFGLLLFAGVLASVAQYLTSYSYSRIPAAVASSATFLIPLFAFILEFLLWGKTYESLEFLALLIILIAGLSAPIWRFKAEQEQKV